MKAIHYLAALLLVVSSLLTACGQKGPLFMPDPVPQQSQEQEQEEEKK